MTPHSPPTDTDDRPGLSDRLFASIYEPFLALGERRGMAQRRRLLLAGASGSVLEIGAGTGLNLPYYPAAVTGLTVSEPNGAMRAVLQRRVDAAEGGPGSRAPLRISAAAAESLPFDDDTFDVVVSTLVLCTVADPVAAVDEVKRVLRPGGRFLVLEHVRGPSGSRLERWQHRLAGPWEKFAAGCRCDRATADVLGDAGFEVRSLREDSWSGMPSFVAPLVIGSLTALDRGAC
ncbi:class I SAM-dependent methyltransferase [Cryptosporangium sp. NPDC048952]|uniref:class I SAM-dependent methyltransferase n=1 Tax=Cryptosporangium sp. NPDC048952 TaxID=3363961 RepID=UPI003715576F